jgi:hypothetical protein
LRQCGFDDAQALFMLPPMLSSILPFTLPKPPES